MKALAAVKDSLSPDGMVSVEGMAAVIAALQKQGTIPANAKVPPEDVIDMTYVKKALGK